MDPVSGDREDLLSGPALGDAPWALGRGATPMPGGTRFSVWAPHASRVEVVVTNATGEPVERRLLEPEEGGGPGEVGEGAAVEKLASGGRSGVFSGFVPGITPGVDYAYVLDGGPPRPDPVSRWQPRGVHGPSRVVDPLAFRWTDAGWTGIAMADFVIYELHVGTFTAAGTFDAVIEHLDALAALGITAVELMPVGQFPGERNWGYDGVSWYAPQNSYGGPDGLKRLIDAAHARGLAVVLDVVYNHLGPEGNYLGEFGPYFTDRYHTPWGAAINYDGPDSDEVRRYAIDNALYWVTEFHVDALRLDAVHGIFDFGARHILAELAARVHAQAARLGRVVQVIAESDLNDPRLVRPPERGGYGLDAQWSDDFHHAVHVALTGERQGYYAGYRGLPDLAAALERRFVYEGQYAVHRRRRHGAPAADVPADRFVVAVQNHDQVGNRARGERLASLVPPERLRLAAAFLLLAPYVPLLFMGEEYGETRPFLYFVSHSDPALVEAVREGRRREHAGAGWSGEIPDPQAEETFLRSRLDRAAASGPTARGLRALYHDLFTLRRTEPALRPGAAGVRSWCDAGGEWLALELTPGQGAPLLALFNVSARSHAVRPRRAAGAWRRCLSTREERYGGPGETGIMPALAGGAELPSPPVAAVLYRYEEP